MAESQFLALLEKEEASIKAMLPTWISPDRWWALMVEVSKSKDLQRIAQSNPGSLIAAVKKLADWGLELDGEEAIILPYGDEAVPQAMYRGLIRRAIEAGAVSHIVADIIKEGDEIEIASGTQGRTLTHRPKFNLKGGRRPIIGAYALVTLPNGTIDFELFESDDIERVKQAALRMAKRRNKDADLSPAWKMFEGEMVKKSVLRRALKRFRGKRDTEAGQKFAAIVEGTRFDVETTGDELPPDNLPTAADVAQTEEQGTRNAQVAGSTPAVSSKPPAQGKLLVKPEPAPTPIDDDSVTELGKQWRSLHGGKSAGLSEWLLENFSVEDLSELMSNQVADCATKMAEPN